MPVGCFAMIASSGSFRCLDDSIQSPELGKCVWALPQPKVACI